MKISAQLTDEAVLAELGDRVAQCRIDRQLTQAALADAAGVSKRTVERIEGGASAQLSSLIRVLRVLELMPGLDQLVPAAEPRPMDWLERQGKKRQRASGARAEERAADWHWDEDA